MPPMVILPNMHEIQTIHPQPPSGTVVLIVVASLEALVTMILESPFVVLPFIAMLFIDILILKQQKRSAEFTVCCRAFSYNERGIVIERLSVFRFIGRNFLKLNVCRALFLN